MIWVFDSGMGGLITLSYLKEQLPDYDYLYLWDTANLPYGEKDPDFIKQRTFDCLHWMFEQWCSIIILACNTASAHAIRARQQMHPEKKVLSITIPWVEKIVDSWYKKPLLLATKSTVDSKIYQSVLDWFESYNGEEFTSYSWIWLVKCIENNASEWEIILCLDKIWINPQWHDCIVLGCTHYPMITKELEIFIGDLPIIDSWYESAHKLKLYLQHHPEIIVQKKKNPITKYFVTGDSNYCLDEERIKISSS